MNELFSRRGIEHLCNNHWHNRWKRSFQAVFRCLKIFSIVSRWISWRYFSRKLDDITIIIFRYKNNLHNFIIRKDNV